MNNSIVAGNAAGSLGNTMGSGKTLAQAFMGVKYALFCDVSGSMDTDDFGEGKSRWDRMVSALQTFQKNHPGTTAVISFHTDVELNVSGFPTSCQGGTNLTAAIEWAINYSIGQLGIIPVVISDGYPDNAFSALEAAKKLAVPIDTIFIGPNNPNDSGRLFLMKLASVTKGTFQETAGAKLLSEKIDILLIGDGHGK